jgi:hypothetical protein
VDDIFEGFIFLRKRILLVCTFYVGLVVVQGIIITFKYVVHNKYTNIFKSFVSITLNYAVFPLEMQHITPYVYMENANI